MKVSLRYLIACICLIMCAAVCQHAKADSVYISELVADNSSYTDEDGDTPDWIELYNHTDQTLSLEGYYLSDDADDLTQWQIPAVNIAPNDFLIIYASNKDRDVVGNNLHTNFKLSSGGESVYLVDPDGMTILHTFTYPSLTENEAYGLIMSGGSQEMIALLDSGAPAKALIPTSGSLGTSWTQEAFNDNSWLSGTTGVGYENGSGFQNLIGLDVIAMRGVNASVYIRVPFTLSSISSISSMTLKMKYDDAFVAYLNGTQIASGGALPNTLTWSSGATQWVNEPDAYIFQPFDVSDHINELQVGDNVLAIHGLNNGTTSSDLLFVPRLEIPSDGEVILGSPAILSAPTPSAVNAAFAAEGTVEIPDASPSRGFYTGPISVTLTSETPATQIRYTLDGSEPTSSSTLYSSPITISSTTKLRVKGYKSNYRESFSSTHTYIFLNDVLNIPRQTYYIRGDYSQYPGWGADLGQKIVRGIDSTVANQTHTDDNGNTFDVYDALTNLPSLCITTDEDNLYDPSTGIYVNATQRWERPASFELIHPDGSEGFQINAGIRIRGGYTRHDPYPKRGFRLFFRQQYGEGKLRYPLFEDEGVNAFDKIDLRSANNRSWAQDSDSRNTMLRDLFARDCSKALGEPYTRSRYYHLYLNGEYWGVYMTEERPSEEYGASYMGGSQEDYDHIKTAGAFATVAPWGTMYPAAGNLNAFTDLYNRAMSGFSSNSDYFAAQGMNSNGEPDSSQTRLLDVENLINHQLAIYYTDGADNGVTGFAGDAGINNHFSLFNRANPDGFKWILHDVEWSQDALQGYSGTPPNGTFQNDHWTSSYRNRTGPFYNSNLFQLSLFTAQILHQQLTANAEYRMKFADLAYKHLENGGALTTDAAQARLDERANQLSIAIAAHAARWGNDSLDRDTWLNAVSIQRSWYENREQVVIGYLNEDGLIPSIDPPTIQEIDYFGSPVISISSSSGTVYYRTDGKDPRAIGGGINGSTVFAPISINQPMHVKARARASNGEWSALEELTVIPSESPLAISEVMYNHPNGNPADFIEIKNVANYNVDLFSYRFDDGIDFEFAYNDENTLSPGEFAVVVDDIDAFSAQHDTNNIRISGEFSGDLSNGGEEIDLEFNNTDLISFTYDDKRNWPQAADGGGHSIVPLASAMEAQESGSLDYGGNWRASTYYEGSPGAEDPTPFSPLVINEVTAHTDTGLAAPFDSNDKIEIYNNSATSISLNGYYLSDDVELPTKWAIPSGITLGAYSYIVFDEDDFHPNRTSGFGLNKAGEQVLLSNVDGIVDMIRFKAQENGVSLGRYPDGSANWVTTQLTPNAANQPTSSGLQLSAIMYNPPTSGNDHEYIKVRNTGSSPITLSNAIGAFRIDGEVSYTFPDSTTLSAGEELWVLSFNPTNTAKLNTFCSEYSLTAANETFVGGYANSLSDRTGRVGLEYPMDSDNPDLPDEISWVVIDEAFYFDQSPWPAGTDGTGVALIRIGLTSWGIPLANDQDGDAMEDSWENTYFGNTDPSAAEDYDADGQTNLEEFIAGSDPTDPLSLFKIMSMINSTISWSAHAERVYEVWWTDDLENEFILIADDISGGSYTDNRTLSTPTHFYKIVVKRTSE